MKTCVVDASFCLSFLLPDESVNQVDKTFSDYVMGNLLLIAPTLLPYEVGNGLCSAIRQKRITFKQANQLLDAFLDLELDLSATDILFAFHLAKQHDLTVYDASYLSLAFEKNVYLFTLDKDLTRIAKKFILTA